LSLSKWCYSADIFRAIPARFPFNLSQSARIAKPGSSRVHWLGFDEINQEQWFGVRASRTLCASCWECHSCPREFAFPAINHEILPGQIPQASFLAQHLREKVRPWIEPAQSYEKNQLGLSSFFFNSLQIAWVMFLLADAVALLPAQALLGNPPTTLDFRRINPNSALFRMGLIFRFHTLYSVEHRQFRNTL
jgi:hypothetical protein